MDHHMHDMGSTNNHSMHSMMAEDARNTDPMHSMDMSHDMSVNGMSHNMSGDGMMHHMMKMYFHTGLKETVLFECWKTNSVGTMVASFIGIFFMAFLYEGLKFYREHLYRKYYTSVNYSSVAITGNKDSNVGEMQKVFKTKILSLPHLCQTFLHVCQLVISYFLMLIFMTFNVYLCLAVALGAGFGYFLFGWRKAIIVNVSEHCH